MPLRYRAIKWTRQKRIYDGVMLVAVLLYLTVFVGCGLLFYPNATAETLLLRAFGTAALLSLHVTLLIGPLSRLDPRFLPLLYNRRHLGVMTFLLGLVHGSLALIQFHALGDENVLVSVFVSNTRFDSLSQFPFQPFGLVALMILFLLAATSHDFWMHLLTPPIWKRLHMLVYLAWLLLLFHVALGVLQVETHPLPAALLCAGAITVVTMHLLAGYRERQKDRQRGEIAGGYQHVCHESELEEGCGRALPLGDDRVALFLHQGEVYAVSNACPHQNGPLGEGRIIDGCITCPWHGYQFLPENGEAPAPYPDRVETYPVKVVAGEVWVALQPRPLLAREIHE